MLGKQCEHVVEERNAGGNLRLAFAIDVEVEPNLRLAGVALFDTRIDQTRTKLDDVYERQERCRIVEQELILSKQRLQKDCEKASLYKDLKNQLFIGRQQELVLSYENAKKGLEKLDIDHQELIKKEKIDAEKLLNNENDLSKCIEKLDILQKNVKELGEDQLLEVQGKLAGIESQHRELERQGLNHKNEGEQLQESRKSIFKRKKRRLFWTSRKN